MDNGFFAYLQRLELMAFFSAYSLLYVIIHFITGNSKKEVLKKFASFLPYGYALVGLLYLGLQLKNLYPDYSLEHLNLTIQQPYLMIWGLLSVLFWIPALGKKPVLSLVHSLVFFFFLARDLFFQLFAASADKNIIRNDMKLFTISLLLNVGAFLFIVLIFFLFIHYKKSKRPPIS